jgi:hypothetical protein
MYEWVSVFEEFMAGAYREGERERQKGASIQYIKEHTSI